MPEAEVEVREVKALKTRSGNTRFVLLDEGGNEYSTFKEAIARDALAAERKRARIEYHEDERNGFRNVYLDRVETLDGDDRDDAGSADDGRQVEEVAWKTAIDAAPYLVGEREAELPPEELFDKLQPFKELVAEDIRDGDEDA
jgi:hypothetical protein